MDDKFFRVPFASSGDKTVVADTPDTTGNVNFQEGYNSYYQLLSTDGNYHPVERDYFNYLLYSITKVLNSLQTYPGAYPFIDAATNNGTAYSYAKGATVLYNNLRYVSLIANNTDQTPSTSSNWLLLTESYVPMAGGTMTGPLILSQDATNVKGAVTLEQLTTAVASLTAAIATATATANSRAAADGNWSWSLVATVPITTSGQQVNFVSYGGYGFYRWTYTYESANEGCLQVFNDDSHAAALDYYNPYTGGSYGDDIFHAAHYGASFLPANNVTNSVKIYKLIKSA